jgi:phosphonate transport system substrate-binding protein
MTIQLPLFQLVSCFILSVPQNFSRGLFWLGLCSCLILVDGCSKSDAGEGWRTTEDNVATVVQSQGSILTIGDIDPDTPVQRMNQIRPLANYLARSLGWEDTNRVRIRIARSVDEMALMIQDGKVDIFMDSVYPTLAVRRTTGTHVIAESIIGGERSYHTLLIAGRTTGLNELSDLVGHTIALQDRNSTSGYMLPAGLLLTSGFSIVQMTGPSQSPPSGQIGYFFSGDEENTLSMIRNGVIGAGAVSVLDYEILPPEIREELVVLGRSSEVPRKLTSVASTMSEEQIARITAILLAITEADLERMAQDQGQYVRPWKWHFRASNESTDIEIAKFETLMDLVEGIKPE